MQKVLVATVSIEPGEGIVIQNGLVRPAIPHVHNQRDIVGHAVDAINKGEMALWDVARRQLRRKRNT